MAVRSKRRHPMLKQYYPDEVSAEDFIKQLKEDSKMFLDNMKDVKAGKKYVEDWCTVYFQWLEMKRP